MKDPVTSSGGFLGRDIVDALVRRGHSFRATVRPFSASPTWSKDVEVVRADLRTPGDLAPALADIDAVIHAAAATSGTEDPQFTSTVRRFRSRFRPLRFPNRKLEERRGWRSPLSFEKSLEASYPKLVEPH